MRFDQASAVYARVRAVLHRHGRRARTLCSTRSASSSRNLAAVHAAVVSRPIVMSVRRAALLLVAFAMGLALVAGLAPAAARPGTRARAVGAGHAHRPQGHPRPRRRRAGRGRGGDRHRRPNGAEVGTGESDADGVFVVGLPEPGTYVVHARLRLPARGRRTVKDEDREVTVAVDAGQSRTVILDLGRPHPRDDHHGSTRFLQLGFAGARFGLIIAITSVGLSLIFGITGLTNFAHGELVTFGAIIAWFINVELGVHLIPATRARHGSSPRSPARCSTRASGGAPAPADESAVDDGRVDRAVAGAAQPVPVLVRRVAAAVQQLREPARLPRSGRSTMAPKDLWIDRHLAPRHARRRVPPAADRDRQGHAGGGGQPRPGRLVGHRRRPGHPLRLGAGRRAGRASAACCSRSTSRSRSTSASTCCC